MQAQLFSIRSKYAGLASLRCLHLSEASPWKARVGSTLHGCSRPEKGSLSTSTVLLMLRPSLLRSFT